MTDQSDIIFNEISEKTSFGALLMSIYNVCVLLKTQKKKSSRKHAYIILTPLNPTFI